MTKGSFKSRSNRVSNLKNLDSDILKCFSFLPLKFASIFRSKLDIIFLRKLCCSFLYDLAFESLQNRKLRLFTFRFPLFKEIAYKAKLVSANSPMTMDMSYVMAFFHE